MKIKFLFIALFCSLTFIACEDEDDAPAPAATTNNTTNNNSSQPSIQFAGADGSLIAVMSTSETVAGPITLNTGVAAFNDNGTATSVGKITLEGVEMTENSAGSYTLSASAQNPMGVTFDQAIDWDVAGTGSFSAFTESNTNDFPTISGVQSPETVDKSDGYTLETGSISNADSVIFMIGEVVRVAAGNTVTYNFTADDLRGLATGTTVASIAPYNFYNRDISGKDIYFVNETVVQKNVTIQE